jgi:predicted nicotinamide N-methyase
MDCTRSEILRRYEDASLSSRKLAILRIDCLNEDDDHAHGSCDGGLANELIDVLQEALLESSTNDLSPLTRILKILKNVTITDDTLSEEVATSKGFRDCLQKIIIMEDDEETLATTIETSLSKLETADKVDPFTTAELQSRLPLVFGIPQNQNSNQQEPTKNLEIMVHTITSEKETETHDVGYVMWPSSVMLARMITENPKLVLDHATSCVLELGAGCGLVGLTAATLLKQHNEEESKEDEVIDDDIIDSSSSVIFTDYLPEILENIERNILLNDLNVHCTTKVAGLDFFDQPGNDDSEYDSSQPNWIDMAGQKRSQVSLILAADVLCYSNDATNVANTIYAGLIDGGKAIVVSADDNKRFGVAGFPDACRNAGLEIDVTRSNSSVDSSRSRCSSNNSEKDAELLDHDLEQTVGYRDQNYKFLIFTITKPISS